MANRQSSQPNTRQQQNPPGENYNAALARWTKAVALFTFLLFVTSAITNCFIYLQWRAAVDAQSDTREQLRAVVVPAGVVVFPANLQDGKPTIYGFAVNFQNLGATRTNTFSAWDSIHYFEGSVPNSQDFSKPYQVLPNHNVGIGPSATITVSPVTLSSEEVENVKSGKGVAVIWGHAEWTDIFHRDKVNPISFCNYIVPETDNRGVTTFKPVPVRADCNISD